MSSLAVETLLTPEEYLASERKATVKSEYLNGEILAMSGASLAHTRITVDIATELNIQLRGRGCEVIASDMRVKTSPKGAYFYPDVVVFCGDPQFEDNVFDTLLNPIIGIEVLSPSTDSFHKTGSVLNSIALSRRNGCRPSFIPLKMCCASLLSDANYHCRTSTDAPLKSFHSSVNCLRPTFRK